MTNDQVTETQKTILVIDDDPDFVLATKAALTAAGYDVATCPDARSALERTRQVRPALIILDVMMETGGAGFHVARLIRREREFAHVPIVMVTAVHQATKLRFSPETDGEYLPVDKFLDKPVPAEVLVREVGALLRKA